MTLSLREALTKSLVERGLLTKEKLKEALRLQEERGGQLKDILVELLYQMEIVLIGWYGHGNYSYPCLVHEPELLGLVLRSRSTDLIQRLHALG